MVLSVFYCYYNFFFKKLQAPPPKAVKKATPAKGTKVVGNGTPAKKAESEDDDSGK